LHTSGDCRPCPWFWKADGCQNKEECGYCHLCPEGELKARKKLKQKQMRLGLLEPKAEQRTEFPAAWAMDMPLPQKVEINGMVLPVDSSPVYSVSSPLFSAAGSMPTTPDLVDGPLSVKAALNNLFVSGAEAEAIGHGGAQEPAPDKTSDTVGAKADGQDADVQEIEAASPAHVNGTCQPCAGFWKPTGCHNGAACKYCHLCPVGEIKARKKNKLAVLRSAVATPKATTAPEPKQAGCQRISFACADAALREYESEQESTTAASGNSDSEGPLSTEEIAEGKDSPVLPGAKSREGLVLPIPPGLPPAAPSHGSILHGSGSCQPCAWFWKPGSCQNGRDCGYCHLCPEGELKARKKTKHLTLRGMASPTATASLDTSTWVGSPAGTFSSDMTQAGTFSLDMMPYGVSSATVSLEPGAYRALGSAADAVSRAKSSPLLFGLPESALDGGSIREAQVLRLTALI
jgi:hypothetical protein